MGYLYVIGCIILITIYIYRFNIQKRKYTKELAIKVTIIESITVFVILYFTSLSGLVSSLYLSIAIFITTLFFLILTYFKQNTEEESDADLRIESMKNTVIKFNITVLPFLISMTIFRFQAFYIQIPLSVLVAFIVHFSSTYLQKGWGKIYFKLSLKIDLSGSRGFKLVWAAVVLFFAGTFFFNFPTNNVERFINLENSKKVYTFFDGYDVFMDNNYDTVKRSENELPSLTSLDTLLNLDEQVITDTENNQIIKAERIFTDYTVYELTTPEGLIIDTYKINRTHNINGFVSNDVIYFFDADEQIVEIMDSEFRFNNLVGITHKEPFFEGNKYDKSFNAFYTDGTDLFIVTNDSTNGVNFTKTTYQVVEKNVDLDFGFYTHFSMFHILIVLISVWIPITNHSKHITVIDFESQYNKKPQV